MPPWTERLKRLERFKTHAALGAVVVALGTWALAFQASSSDGEWSGSLWSSPSDLRGKTVRIGSGEVETTAEREKRLAIKHKELRNDLGNMKKDVLGDGRKTRGDDILPESAPIPPGFDQTPRDACMQMKLEFPERYGNVDCMSDKYDDKDPWYRQPSPRER